MHAHDLIMSVARLGAWLVLLTIVFLPLEALFAVRRRNLLSKRLPGDLGFFLISGLIPSLLLTPVLGLLAVGVHAVVPDSYYEHVSALPLWLRAGLALLIGELGFYWGHRWSHSIPFMWRFHSVHHSATEIYYLVSARAHPIDNVFVRLCGLIPVFALGLATPLTPEGGVVSALLVLLATGWGFLIHANVRWHLGPLEHLVATPAFHHWHHTLENPRDRNFASMLPLMDRLFGTYYVPRGQWPAAYGIDTPMPATVLGQLAHPVLPARKPAHAAVPAE